MDEETPTLKNIAKEFATPGYWGRARQRKASTKTVWDLIFTPIGFVAMGGYWYAFTQLFLWFHLLIYPADGSRLQFLIGGPMTIAQALIFIVPMFSSIPLGFITSNALMWLIPSARRASEQKAKGVKWATFRGAQLGLLKIALVIVPIGLACGIVGAFILGH